MSEMIHGPIIFNAYLGGPLENCSREDAVNWRHVAENQLRERGQINSLIPGFDTTLNDSRTITWMDFRMIDMSEACLFNLTYLADDGVGTGTLIEIGYAAKAGKLIVAYTDKPWSRKHMFLKGCLTPYLFGSAQEAIDYLVGFNHRKELKKVI